MLIYQIKDTSPPPCTSKPVTLTSNTLKIVSTDNSVSINKTLVDGVTVFNLKINEIGTSGVNIQDTPTVALAFTADATKSLTASVKISSVPNNILSKDDNGLFVLAQNTETANGAVTSPSATVVLSGTLNRGIQVNVKISANSGNGLVINADGLYASSASGGSGVNTLLIQSSDFQGGTNKYLNTALLGKNHVMVNMRGLGFLNHVPTDTANLSNPLNEFVTDDTEGGGIIINIPGLDIHSDTNYLYLIY